jgi:AcrR family transcriptional regulator
LSSDRPLRADARRNRERILAAAEKVFADKGSTAATEEVAAAAGVAIGTVFRHFPTKADLLAAIMKDLLGRLGARAAALVEESPETALFTFFADLVEQAAAKKAVVELLAADGIDVGVADSVESLRRAVGDLLRDAKRAGTVRANVRLDEVLALLAATTQGALVGGWSPSLRRRTLAVVFAGLRPPEPM